MRKTALFIAAAATLLLTACGPPAPVPQDNYYRINEIAPADTLASPKFDGVLMVERFIGDGLLGGRPIVYADEKQSHVLNEYPYHFWIDSPPALLSDEMISFLRKAKVAKAVVTPEMRVKTDFILTGRVRHMERITGDPGKAVVEIELALKRTDGDALMMVKTYKAEPVNEDGGVAGAVKAISGAMDDIFNRFLKDLIDQ